jgi:hypothetical protein
MYHLFIQKIIFVNLHGCLTIVELLNCLLLIANLQTDNSQLTPTPGADRPDSYRD